MKNIINLFSKTFIYLSFTVLLAISSISFSQNINQIPLRTIDGDTIYLSQIKNKKILIVNTASKCGFTPQYADLQKLYDTNKEHLEIIAFPTDNFMNQEFKNSEEIKTFCTKNYGVTFPIMDKIDVKGDNIHPLYQILLDGEKNGFGAIKIEWNFHKILLDENHEIIADFPSKMSPLSKEATKFFKK